MCTENEKIIDSIKFFTRGKYRERKPYLSSLLKGEVVSYNGFDFQRDTWCWIVWKPTDIGENPQYKGKPLCKVIPRNEFVDVDAVLNAQQWIYI